MIIPDIISLPGIIIGFILSFFLPEINPVDSLVGMVAGGGALLLIGTIFLNLTGKHGMGWGDIKLLAMIGAWLGWRPLPIVVLISSILGIIIGGGSLLLSGKGLSHRIPFGPFLSMGTIIYLLFGNIILYRIYYMGITAGG
jgi:leader peptidase (prepilin peptidase)/N-methyltransferase